MFDAETNIDKGTIEYMYSVVINAQNEYEFLDTFGNRVLNVPNIPCDSPNVNDLLADTIGHITTFKYLEGIQNRAFTKHLDESLTIEIVMEATHSNTVNIKHGNMWKMSFINKSEAQLYVGMFNFRQNWELKPLTPESGFVVIPARKNGVDGKLPLGIKMQIPDYALEAGRKECEDVFKIFVTTKATHLRLKLPSIFDLAYSRQAGSIRGVQDPGKIFSSLGMGNRGERQDEWITRNFIVRTSLS